MNTDPQLPTEYEKRACAECGTAFDAPGAYLLGRFVAYNAFCAVCLPKVRETQEKERMDLIRRRLEAQWLEVCPDEFITVDRRLLPDAAMFDRVMGWSFGARGLVAAGKSGTGKSRSCWALLHREFVAGRSIFALSAYDLSRWPSLVLNEPREADAKAKRMVTTDILYLDDPFKSRLSPTVEETLFATLDERTSRRRPTVFSFNDNFKTLVGRLTTDRGPAFLRRIRDFCEVVKPTSTGGE